MGNIIQSVKGARDFYPEDMAIRAWLYSNLREVSTSFGYQEFDGPFLEKIDLYAAKSGEELVKEQSFVFQDRGGEYITLRPELTPSLARMVAQQQKELIFPLHWWSFGPFWRYERPQKGRTREFFQWNIDVIGSNSAEADAELLAVAATLIKKIGFLPENVKISVNNRRLMEHTLNELGVKPEQMKPAFRLIDRRDKLRPSEWEAFAYEIGLTQEQYTKLEKMLSDPELWKKSPELCRIFDILQGMGLMDYFRFDAGVVRGLDYYTSTVFEAYHLEEGGRALLGGGHYDNLVEDVGGSPLPGVGFAMGDVYISYLLRKYKLIPEGLKRPSTFLVTIFDDARVVDSYKAANFLRQLGETVICYPEVIKLPKQIKYADRLGIRFVVIVGPDEAERGEITVKDLLEHEQRTFTLKNDMENIHQWLEKKKGL